MSSSMYDDQNNGLAPGHPAGTDEPISAGAVLSGTGQRAGGGSLDATPRSMTDREATVPAIDDGQGLGDGASPTILVAVEDDEQSVRVLRVAHRLFGDGAKYLAINVGQGRYTSMRWAYVYPVSVPATWYPPAWTAEQPSDMIEADDRAVAVADNVADEAGLASVTGLGDAGDPATAILDAAREHGVDVVVVGSHERSWFSRLFSESVEQELLRSADVSVLVVKSSS